ncbi:hypothetical protein RVR_5203 [Actinacidiphila reveromycinica]|uniref:Uncharacterized protein n=1 Tax=Actinacidiphila reveromycinica TaxID=659352 RepID=A0A7U3UU82_9ACTN|nr:hypothetical protein [Streptomyces sp. SN-593]BBA98849.1 hypothetical protein RVR_5203 [Streptomyces sp. SN-593]
MSPETTASAAELRTSGEPRTWRITATNGLSVSGYLPPWAYEDPSASGVDPHLLPVLLVDVELFRYFHDVIDPLVGPGDGLDEDGHVTAYFCAITCRPFADRDVPDLPVHPVLTVQVTETDETVCHDPGELAALIARLRAHTDHLDQHVLPAFTAIHDDWRIHHRTAAGRPTPPVGQP